MQIAAYRDPELILTLRDCIEKAKFPENLVFSICWQHNPEDTWDTLDEWKDDPRFKIIDVNYLKTKGTCWARSMLQQQYNGETYTLQLDSHHRFAPDWDLRLLQMFHGLVEKGVKKPLITSYVPSYNPYNDPDGRVHETWLLNFNRFAPENQEDVLHTHPSAATPEQLKEPILNRFYSAHFAFSWGKFVEEVPHDPEGYFHGEEPGIAVRAWTWGYDLYCPNENLVWHEYHRMEKKEDKTPLKPRHWDDHKEGKGTNWGQIDLKAKRRFKSMLGIGLPEPVDLGKYGLGKVRTLEQYEAFSGIRFKDKFVQKYTLDGNDPPNPYYAIKSEYDASFLPFYRFCIDIGWDKLPEPDYEYLVVAFHDEDDETIEGSRQDVDKRELETILKDPDGYGKIWRNFYYTPGKPPAYWVVWPVCKDKSKGNQGFMERFTGSLVHAKTQSQTVIRPIGGAKAAEPESNLPITYIIKGKKVDPEHIENMKQVIKVSPFFKATLMPEVELLIENASADEVEHARHFDPGENSMLIQILDEGYAFPASKHNFKESYQFNFCDWTTMRAPYGAAADHEMIQDSQAEEIARVLKKAKKQGMNIVVHCLYGRCRSTGVCEAAKTLGYKLVKNDKDYLPNTRVSKMIIKALKTV